MDQPTPSEAPSAPPEAPAGAPADPRVRPRNWVAIAALIMGAAGYLMFLAIPFSWLPQIVVEVSVWSAVLAMPVGLVGAILSWVNVLRRRDWWFGVAGMVAGFAAFAILGAILNDAIDGYYCC